MTAEEFLKQFHDNNPNDWLFHKKDVLAKLLKSYASQQRTEGIREGFEAARDVEFYDVCENCGAGKGLHHFETDQCPKNGIECRDGLQQEWGSTIYKDRIRSKYPTADDYLNSK